MTVFNGAKLTASGIAYPVATEIAAQMTAATGKSSSLVSGGLSGPAANAISAGITGSNLTEAKLAGVPGLSSHQAVAIAKLFAGTL